MRNTRFVTLSIFWWCQRVWVEGEEEVAPFALFYQLLVSWIQLIGGFSSEGSFVCLGRRQEGEEREDVEVLGHQCHAICMRKHDSCCQLRLVTLNVQTDCVFSSIEWCWLCAAGCAKCAKYIGCRSVGLPVQALDPKKSVLMLKSAPNLKCVFNSHQHFSSFCFKMWRSLILCLYFGDALW